MNYDEAVDYLYSLGHEMQAMKLGLDRIRRLAHACGDPQLRFPAVHIAGTNGKGSTAAMVAAIAHSSGLRTGLFTSPHLVEITERIEIDGRAIDKADFARLGSIVREAGERLVVDGEAAAAPTFFEQVTAIGYLYFAEREVDLTVLETGLGGRLDATNICRPVVTAITPVGADHQQYLGETLAEIAGEKAGILKPGVPLVLAPQRREAADTIVARAAQIQAPIIDFNSIWELIVSPGPVESVGCYRLYCRTANDVYETVLSLRGRHQAINAVVSILVAEQLALRGFPLAREAVATGLSNAQWPGRLELLETGWGRHILIDGAHNPDGARKLRAFLDEHFTGVCLTLVFGVMSDKALDEMAQVLFPAASVVVAAPIANPRAVAPERIAELAERRGCRAIVAESAGDAIEVAMRETAEAGVVCACGSLYLVGEISREVKPRNTRKKDAEIAEKI